MCQPLSSTDTEPAVFFPAKACTIPVYLVYRCVSQIEGLVVPSSIHTNRYIRKCKERLFVRIDNRTIFALPNGVLKQKSWRFLYTCFTSSTCYLGLYSIIGSVAAAVDVTYSTIVDVCIHTIPGIDYFYVCITYTRRNTYFSTTYAWNQTCVSVPCAGFGLLFVHVWMAWGFFSWFFSF